MSLRDLPSVDELLRAAGTEPLLSSYGRSLTTDALRRELDEVRSAVRQGEAAPDPERIVHSAAERLKQWSQPRLQPVVNATGVILHTNLGRAPLSQEATAAMQLVADGYNLRIYVPFGSEWCPYFLRRIAERGGQSKARAAYIAGLAARQQGKLNLAARWLRRASRQGEEAVVTDARAELGIVYHQQGKYGRAARVLERASQDLLGNDRAQALLFAGIARQKLGDWDQARRQLRFARAAATNSGLKRKINRQLKVTGYTIQVGAFREAANARKAARNWRSKAQNLGLRDPRLVSGQGQGGGLTSVQLGRFDTVAAANRARQRLGADNAIVVPLAGQGTR